MFKNIFKIVTCGIFRGRTDSQRKGEDFNDEHIYFRCLMGVKSMPWTKDLNALYKSRMEGDNGKNARPGFLIKTADNKFFIAPLLPNLDRKNDYIMIRDFQNQYGDVLFRDSRIHWDGGIAYCVTGNQWANKPEKLLTREQYEEFKESLKGLTEEERTEKIRLLNHGKQIIRYTKISYVDWAREHWREIPDDVRESYEHDRNRRGVNLFTDHGILKRDQIEALTGKKLPDIKSLIPCYFLCEGEQVTAFGHGQCFRIPYKAAIGDLVPAALKDTAVIDFADAVFGREKLWASRVYFEDAVPADKINPLKKSAAHPLMQPNPTSYQLYLAQDGSETLSHWDSFGAQIRGYKLYWHNETEDWCATKAEIELDRGKAPDERMTKDLTPLAKGTKFIAKIRFQNLSEVELGALMMIFDLNGNGGNAAYKIGMGKSLGFGSVKITPTLFIESGDAYAKFFDGNGWANPYRNESPSTYLAAFKNYLDAQATAWEKVMEELNKILRWDNKPAPSKIQAMRSVYDGRTMQVDERFKQRVKLPSIGGIARGIN